MKDLILSLIFTLGSFGIIGGLLAMIFNVALVTLWLPLLLSGLATCFSTFKVMER